jgi:putative transcriptional regulator
MKTQHVVKQKHLDALESSLQEALEHAKGKISLKTKEFVLPKKAPEFPASEIAHLRKRTGLSQAVFARVLNVSKESEAKWEQGTRHPAGSALRLLQIMKKNPDLVLASVS